MFLVVAQGFDRLYAQALPVVAGRHDQETKVLRGDKLVTFAEAKIRPRERVTVTFNNDEDANFLSVVRLEPIK